ncbi:putative LOC102095723, partial [Columba livia]
MKVTDWLWRGSGTSVELVRLDLESGWEPQASCAGQLTGLSWFSFVLNSPVLHHHRTFHMLPTSLAQHNKPLVKPVGTLPQPPRWRAGLSHVC